MPPVSLSLAEDEMNALALLLKEMYPVLLVHKIDFCTLLEDQKFERGKVLTASVDSVLTAKPYNVRHVTDELAFNHDVFASAG